MNSGGDFDYSTLNWVKGEIDETVKQALQAFEAYVESPEDETQMRFCITYLHQVHGTLQMVELYGAAMLAEEMELLAYDVLKGAIAQKEDAYEVLMRAMVQLPDYLERLQGGQRDLPIVLLPLLNDLRAARGKNLLSETVLFSPDLSIAPPADAVASSQPTDIRAAARKLRHQYQLGLVSWFRNKDRRASLTKLLKVIEELQGAVSQQAVRQVFWIAGGIIEALIDEGIDSSVSTKLLLGQIDRQVKRLIDEGEQSFTDSPPTELVKNLLYYVARASSAGERVSGLKAAFKLDALLPAEDEIDRARHGLSGCNVELMHTVAEAIKEDLARVKEVIDIFVRNEGRPVADFEPLVEVLKQTGDTLGMIGLGMGRNVVLQQASVLLDIVEGKVEPSESTLMEIAEALLYIESILAGLVVQNDMPEARGGALPEELEQLHDAEAGRATEPLLAETDYRQLLEAVVREAKVDMARVKELIVSFINAPWQHDLLTDVPQLIKQINGSLTMLSLPRATALLSACNSYITSELLENKVIPTEHHLDTLADAISGIEYYLEAFQEGRSERDAILDAVERSVAQLGYPVTPEVEERRLGDAVRALGAALDAWLAAPDKAALEVLREHMAQLGAALDDEEAQFAKELAVLITAMKDTVEQVATGTLELSAQLIDGLNETVHRLSQSIAAADEAAAVPTHDKEAIEPALVEEAPETAAAPVVEEEIDEEIIEIFIEEAQEQLAAISEMRARWQEQPEDEDALATLRRAFHTLKGSGRLVGAALLGEFAWSFENMLNRVIGGTIEATPELFGLLHEAEATLAELVRQFQDGTAPAGSVDALMDRAWVLSGSKRQAAAPKRERPEAPTMVPPESVPESALTVSPEPAIAAGEAGAAEVAPMDPVLCDIFSKEASGHLAQIRAFCDQPPEPALPTEVLLRALHTLHGSARMAGVTHIAELSGQLEKYAKALEAQQVPVSDAGIMLLRDSGAAAGKLVDAMAAGTAAELAGGEDLLARAVALFEAEIGEYEEPPPAAEPEAGIESAEKWLPEPVPQATEGEQLQGDSELMEIFLEEGAEILDSCEIALQRWIKDPGDSHIVAELQRELHTLKGGARMAGISEIGDLSHAVESMLTAVVEEQVSGSQGMAQLVQRAHDCLLTMLEQARRGAPVEAADELIRQATALLATGFEGAPQELAAEPPEAEPAQTAAAPAPPPELLPEAEPVPERRALGRRAEPRPAQDQVRVGAGLLNHLVNLGGEISIFRSRLEQQVNSVKFNLVEMDQTVARLRDQLRNLEIETEAQIQHRMEEAAQHDEEFDPLEFDRFSLMQQLSRSLMESVTDLVSIQRLLENQTRESETLLLQQSRVNTDLQEGLMRTRMVPFSSQLPRLQRIVRQTCNELGKEAELRVVGADGEMDRTVLERVMAPLEHMLRNAIDHGIEDGALRIEAGKPKGGTITLSFAREGSEVALSLADDGAGIDMGAIRAKAAERGLVDEDATLTDSELLQFIIESGFSTAQQVTQISGRGVGMDVVNSEIKQLGGSLHIDSSPGRGATFTIRLPFTLSINRALMTYVGDEIYAIPLLSVEGIARATREELEGYYADESAQYEYAGQQYQFMHLGTALGVGRPVLPEPGKKVPVLLVRAGDHRVALQVEGLRGSREIVVKSVGPQISTVRGISGATILGDGRVVLILDLGAVARMDIAHHAAPLQSLREVSERAAVEPTVMVVDDSITVRKVTERFLRRHHMNAITAKDGVDALAVLQDHIPDVMLLDIEMPRMDGYELATYMRNDERFRHIPIIMITSRTGEKHRQRALQIGVDRYLGKPYQESELLEHIQSFLKERELY